jgi:hypothetical protein
VNDSLITAIAANLAILLLASWVIGLFIFIRTTKDKEELEAALTQCRKKIKQLKKAQATKQFNSPTLPTPEFPLEPVIIDENGDESLYLLDAFNNLSNDLLEKEKQLASLAKLHTEQQHLLEDLDNTAESRGDVMGNHHDTKKIIDKLQHDLKINQRVIRQLEGKLREGQDKDGRIAVLEETERRLRARVDQLKKNKEQAAALADGLKKSNEKKQALIRDNEMLKRNIKSLSNASKEQLATINEISSELERATNLEQHQRRVISGLEIKLQLEKSTTNDSGAVAELEEQLQHTSETLERTLKEKEIIEYHLLDMDKALEDIKETEAALERARKEIETLEMYFPDSEPFVATGNTTKETEVYQPLPQLTITEEEDPELFTAINDNRLFGILQEFWMTLDTPPLQLVSENNISRPKNLSYWTKTPIHNDEYFIAIGTNERLTETLSKAMFNKTVATLEDSDLKDSLGELGNVIAGTLANELNPEYVVGMSKHINNDDIDLELKNVAIAAEILMKANEQPLYIALAKPVTPGQD